MQQLRHEAARAPKIHGVDGFGGAAGMCRAMLAKHWRCEYFDIKSDPIKNDCLHPAGLRHWILLMLRCAPGALIILGPPCSFWIWLTRSVSGRSQSNPAGDTTSAWVRQGNAIGKFVANTLQLAHHLKLFYFVEQPASSLLGEFEPMKASLKATGAFNVRWQMGAFGASSTKPQIGWTNAPWYAEFASFARVAAKRRREEEGAKEPSNLSVKDNVDGSVTGNPHALESSAEYPSKFCDALISLHHEHFKSAFCSQIMKEMCVPSGAFKLPRSGY